MFLLSLKSHSLRNAISIALVLLFAAYCDIFFSFSHQYWISLTAYLVCQTMRGRTARQGMIVFLICMLAVLVATILKVIVFNEGSLYSWIPISGGALSFFILSFIFIIGDYLIYINRLFSNKIRLILIFLLMVLIAGLPPFITPFMIKNRVIDIMIGALIGLIGALVILPIKIHETFSESMMPILKRLNDYAQCLSHYFRDPQHQTKEIILFKKNEMEISSHQGEALNEWFFENGFTRELRSGYRFFIIHLEWVTEIFISINYMLQRNITIQSIKLLSPALLMAMEKNQELLKILMQYFDGEKIQKTDTDYQTDILQLQKTLQKHTPGSIELLDMSPEYLRMTALVTAIQNLRSILLQLVLSLPPE